MRGLFLSIFLMGFAGSVSAENSEERVFLTANILGIFYHEFGHAVIDIEDVPIFGQEEDAADVFSIFLIDAFFEAEVALQLAYDAAFGFAAEADDRGDEIPWWDVHGPDEQRFYNTVCLFYGADPDAREEFAQEMGLPEERADYCPDEYEQAAHAWGNVLDRMTTEKGGQSITLDGGEGLVREILSGEIKALNEEFKLSRPLSVTIEACGEANAFYDPGTTGITFCEEFIPHLEDMFARL